MPGTRLRVWTDGDHGPIFIEHPAMTGKPTQLQYYAVVNALLGAVAIKWVTPTPGLRKRYRVSVPCTQLLFCCCHFWCRPPPSL
jgi:hypothetical protein